MTVFDRINDFITQAGVVLKAGGVVIAIIAFLVIIGWGTKATLGRLVVGVVVAGAIITVIAKPDLLKSDMDNTFAAPAAGLSAQYDTRHSIQPSAPHDETGDGKGDGSDEAVGLWRGGGGEGLQAATSAAGGAR
ncbi:hypothetical protein [Kineococcus sp. SYSU DK003]|uniref:hypothetical protein n=1 Tax=Kineococcus sp. SYSU DK003 TaxID=3383124 RepID=UPI003D7DA3C7